MDSTFTTNAKADHSVLHLHERVTSLIKDMHKDEQDNQVFVRLYCNFDVTTHKNTKKTFQSKFNELQQKISDEKFAKTQVSPGKTNSLKNDLYNLNVCMYVCCVYIYMRVCTCVCVLCVVCALVCVSLFSLLLCRLKLQ